jgi:hypothetical protein
VVVADVEVVVTLLVLLELTLFVESLLVVEETPVDEVLLVVEVIKVVVTLCVVTTAARVHCAYPKSCNSALMIASRPGGVEIPRTAILRRVLCAAARAGYTNSWPRPTDSTAWESS